MATSMQTSWVDFLKDVDVIIDVRSPHEFAHDHIPGAINLPVLYDDQHAQIGTMYKQESPFSAKRLGAAWVSENISQHLHGHFQDKGKNYRPAIYCWRGGQRSGAMATILSAVGWKTKTLAGGYKMYRQHVVDALYHKPLSQMFIRVDGNTGTGKTSLLQMLAKNGEFVVDLEAIAHHRGSVLGGLGQKSQPSQKWFESQIYVHLQKSDGPIWIEAESLKIGKLRLPPKLWEAMCDAPIVMLESDSTRRVRHLSTIYDVDGLDAGEICEKLEFLRPLRGHEVVTYWQNLARAHNWSALIESLLAQHYDPSYRRSRQANVAADATFNILDSSGSVDINLVDKLRTETRLKLGSHC